MKDAQNKIYDFMQERDHNDINLNIYGCQIHKRKIASNTNLGSNSQRTLGF